MSKLLVLQLVVLTTFVLCLFGCYTGEIVLDRVYIRNYTVKSEERNGQTHIILSGVCGMQMGVSGIKRELDGDTVKIKLYVSDSIPKDRTIYEDFIIPKSVSRLKMGNEIIWRRGANSTPQPFQPKSNLNF